jgi:hypothetical protein
MKTAITVFTLVLVMASYSHADIFVVRPDGLGITPDIQTAINSSADGDEIWLISGVFTGPGNRDIELGGHNILIKSFDDDPAACIIDCGPAGPGNEHRAFRLASSMVQTTTFQSITIRNGYAEPGGGAMLFVGGATAIMNNCVFENNATGMTEWHGGGAVYVDRGGLPVFNDCVFRNNRGFAGGAVTTNHGGRVTFNDCRFIANQAVRGGALYGITSDKFGCLFYANEAEVGGAVWGNAVAVDYYENCTLDGNRAAIGGAIFAMANYGGSVELVDTIISNCPEGSAMDISPAVPVTLSCCNLYGNVGGDWTAPFAAQVDERGNFSANPCYCDVFAEDFHLCADSYARAGGHPWGCDQLVGAYDVGCGECGCTGPVSVEGISFGALKSLYR